MNKKSIIILIVVAAVVFIVALFIPSVNSEGQVIKTLTCSDVSENQENTTNLTKVSCSTYNELISEKEDNLILIARPTCSYCTKFIPILEEIVEEYGITVNYFDTDALSTDEVNEFYQSATLFTSNQFGTPTLIVTNDQQIVEYSIGYKEKDAAVEWLEKVGIIK